MYTKVDAEIVARVKELRGCGYTAKSIQQEIPLSIPTLRRIINGMYDYCSDSSKRVAVNCPYAESCFNCPLSDCKVSNSYRYNKLKTDP